MLDTSALAAAMVVSAKLWTENKNLEALRILDDWIAKAEAENESVWVDSLCGEASLIASSMDDLTLIRRYCDKVLSHENENASVTAMAFYQLAEAMFRRGETDLGQQYAAKSYELVAGGTNDRERSMKNILLKCWPEIGNWKA